MLTAFLVIASVASLTATAAGPAEADQFTGTVTVGGTAVQEHVVEAASDGLLAAVVRWSTVGRVKLELLPLIGDRLSNDQGLSPRSVGAAVTRGAYRVRVTATSGTADYTLTTSIRPADGSWFGAVRDPGVPVKFRTVTVPAEGVVTATVAWESVTAPASLRAHLTDSSGTVFGEAQGGASPLVVEEALPAGTYSLWVTALEGEAEFLARSEVQAGVTTGDKADVAVESGALTVDDAARHTLWAELDPGRVPEAYQDSASNTNGDLSVLRYWEQASPETQEELAAQLRPVEVEAAGPAARASLARWTDCGPDGWVRVVTTVLRCAAVQDVDGDGTADFDVLYNVDDPPAAADGSGVRNVDVAPSNGRPDFVDRVIDSTTKAWGHFEDLGFRPVAGPVRIILWSGMNPGAGLSLPRLPVDGGDTVDRLVFLDTDDLRVSAYLPRHELFHQFQYEYIGITDIRFRGRAMIWWMEATANWGAQQAQSIEPDEARRDDFYANDLDEVLGEPERRWDRTSLWVGGAEYGSFILAEYLDQRFGGPAAIQSTWEAIDNGNVAPARRPIEVVEELLDTTGDGLAEEMVRYRQWTYVLSGEPGGADNFGVGFVDDPNDSDGVDDVETFWRPILEGDPRTASDGGGAARPRRTSATVVPGAAAQEGSVVLERSGAGYVDLDLPGGDRELRVSVDDEFGNVAASILAFSDYPRLCAPPVTIPDDPQSGDALTWRVPADCASATLVLLETPSTAPTSGVTEWTAAVTIPPDPDAMRSFTDPILDARFSPVSGPVVLDVAYPRVDVVQQTVRYGLDEIELRARVLEPVPDVGIVDNGYLEWWLDVNADDSADAYAALYREGGLLRAGVFEWQTQDLLCDATPVLDGTYYGLRFAADCVLDPPQLGVFVTAAEYIGASNSGHFDAAPVQSDQADYFLVPSPTAPADRAAGDLAGDPGRPQAITPGPCRTVAARC